MKHTVAIVVGVLIALTLATGAYLWMESLIPAGVPMASKNQPEFDPNDHTPREPILLAGPHQDEFISNCTACHSTRLTMTQPKFSQSKWTEVVHKMVVTYGAQITPSQEEQIVKYLVMVRGSK